MVILSTPTEFIDYFDNDSEALMYAAENNIHVFSITPMGD